MTNMKKQSGVGGVKQKFGHWNMRSSTLKTPGSAVTLKRVHWGQTPFRVNDDPEISQIDK